MNDSGPAKSSGRVSPLRALSLSGALASWRIPILAALAGLAAWEGIFAGRVETALFLCGFLVPFFAGTGTLALAKLGRFDMVVGAGVTRRRLVVTAAAGAILPLAAVLGMAVAFSGIPGPAKTAFAGMAIFMAGVGFLGGLAGPTALVGVIWFVMRGLAFVTPWGYDTIQLVVMARGAPGSLAVSPGRLALVLAGMPELSTNASVPGYMPALFALAGVACIALAFAWFERADLPGKRTA